MIRHTLIRLGAAFALAWATTSMVAGPGSAAMVELTASLNFSGVFLAIFYLGAAAGAVIGGRSMDRFGRKPPLVAAYVVSACGFLIAGAGVSLGVLPLFAGGTFIFAAAFGTIGLTRLAAAELFPPEERGRGVAWIQISAIFGAVAGPLLVVMSEPLAGLIGRSPLSLVWFIAPPLLLLGAISTAGAREPTEVTREMRAAAATRAAAAPPQSGSGRVVDARAAGRSILAGSVSLAASQAAMASIMGVAGAAVSHAGHSVQVLGWLMFVHFVGMFGLSRLVGRLADSWGSRPTILTGLVLLGCGGITVASIPGLAGFVAGLLLVGFGWSFGFIGSTVLIAAASEESRRARVLGRADLGAQLASAVVATGGGLWFASNGVTGLGIVALSVAAVPLFFLRGLVLQRA